MSVFFGDNRDVISKLINVQISKDKYYLAFIKLRFFVYSVVQSQQNEMCYLAASYEILGVLHILFPVWGAENCEC